MWCRVTIFSLGVALHYSIISSSLTQRLLLLTMLLFRRGWMSCWPRVQLNHPLDWLIFTPNMFVVPKCMGGLHPILNLKWLNGYMHVTTFKMPTITQVQLLAQPGYNVFFSDLLNAYLHVPIVKHHHQFLQFGNTSLFSGRHLPLGLAKVPRVFSILTKLILFLCCHKGLFTWMISWSLLSACCEESSNFLVLSFGSSWFTC